MTLSSMRTKYDLTSVVSPKKVRLSSRELSIAWSILWLCCLTKSINAWLARCDLPLGVSTSMLSTYWLNVSGVFLYSSFSHVRVASLS